MHGTGKSHVGAASQWRAVSGGWRLLGQPLQLVHEHLLRRLPLRRGKRARRLYHELAHVRRELIFLGAPRLSDQSPRAGGGGRPMRQVLAAGSLGTLFAFSLLLLLPLPGRGAALPSCHCPVQMCAG